VNTSPKIADSRIVQALQNRMNYIRQATPERVGRLLDEYYRGGFGVAELWDCIERRHPHTAAVVGKRKADVGRMDWQIIKKSDLAEGEEAEAERHADALKGFYDSLTTTTALKQDETGGVGLLAQQMLDARGKEFSIHEWIWKLPRGGRGLTAEFRWCPMWWFENRSGRVRYLVTDGMQDGIPMDPAEWLVTAAPAPLMEATTVCWLFAHASLNDWLVFCDRFGMPGILGKTDAQPGSPEWDALATAVASFGPEWSAVVNREAGIEFVEAKSGGNLPHAPLVDVMHRTIATLWRGGDLSSMSAGQGQGQGASVQGDETDLLQEDDARFVSEKLQERVDRLVIGYHFGRDVEPLAYFQLVAPSKPDTDRELRVDDFFLKHQLPLGKDDLYERYSRRRPDPSAPADEIVVGAAAPDPLAGLLPETPDPRPQALPAASPFSGLANAVRLLNAAATATDARANRELRESATAEIGEAMAEVLQPVTRRLREIAEMDNPTEQREAMAALQTDLPGYLRRAAGADADLAEAFERLLGSSYLNGIESVPPATPAA